MPRTDYHLIDEAIDRLLLLLQIDNERPLASAQVQTFKWFLERPQQIMEKTAFIQAAEKICWKMFVISPRTFNLGVHLALLDFARKEIVSVADFVMFVLQMIPAAMDQTIK